MMAKLPTQVDLEELSPFWTHPDRAPGEGGRLSQPNVTSPTWSEFKTLEKRVGRLETQVYTRHLHWERTEPLVEGSSHGREPRGLHAMRKLVPEVIFMLLAVAMLSFSIGAYLFTDASMLASMGIIGALGWFATGGISVWASLRKRDSCDL
jgi:hypothetical protein